MHVSACSEAIISQRNALMESGLLFQLASLSVLRIEALQSNFIQFEHCIHYRVDIHILMCNWCVIKHNRVKHKKHIICISILNNNLTKKEFVSSSL